MNSLITNIGVVFGGNSGEHEISIKSAKNVIKALRSGKNKDKFHVLPIYIDRQGKWYSSELSETILEKGILLENKFHQPSELSIGFRNLPKESEEINVWYPVLHGPNGEDGTVQGLFKLSGKPFVGSDVLGSALGMDKLAMKAAFLAAGLPQVPYISVNTKDLSNKNQDILLKRIEKLTYPCFVKPANLGSSVGISKVTNQVELLEGLRQASLLDNRIVIEKGVNARELECAAIGNKKMQASLVGEVQFNSEWYDYKTKYSDGACKLLIPAPIPKHLSDQIQKLTLRACDAISAKGMARVDFFYSESQNKLWVNEINTLPGFTSQSMYPLLWEASGLNIENLVAKLVETARE